MTRAWAAIAAATIAVAGCSAHPPPPAPATPSSFDWATYVDGITGRAPAPATHPTTVADLLLPATR